MSSKVVSYYDWEQSWKKTGLNTVRPNKKSLNSIGMSDDDFKRYIKKWKNSNL